jgi:cyclophilin family peptidyl-prolyl cis-trans isomerase
VYRVFPAFVVHEKALLAAQALEAVALQDPSAYFSMLDRFFAQQSQWSPMEEDAFSAWLLENLLELGLEREPFESAMLDPAIQDRLLQQLDADLQAGVTYTPYLLINGKTYPNIPRDLNTIRSLVELSLVELRQYGECPPPLLTEGQSYIAVLQTTKGEITVQLFPENAPQAVNNFIFLSEQGWYQDVPFFRVIPGSYALTGDPSGTGLGSPGYTFASEIDPALSFDRPGVVAMNNTGAPDTNGSAFFITYQALPEFDGAFTIFGQVIDGLDILQQLTPRDPVNDGEPIQADRLLSVTIQQP